MPLSFNDVVTGAANKFNSQLNWRTIESQKWSPSQRTANISATVQDKHIVSLDNYVVCWRQWLWILL